MKRMRGMTAEERTIYWCSIVNSAQEVAYRVEQYNDALDSELKDSIRKRREREMLQAIERLAGRYNEGVSDAALRYINGEKAVTERDRRRGGYSNVVPLKRKGFVVQPIARE